MNTIIASVSPVQTKAWRALHDGFRRGETFTMQPPARRDMGHRHTISSTMEINGRAWASSCGAMIFSLRGTAHGRTCTAKIKRFVSDACHRTRLQRGSATLRTTSGTLHQTFNSLRSNNAAALREPDSSVSQYHLQSTPLVISSLAIHADSGARNSP